MSDISIKMNDVNGVVLFLVLNRVFKSRLGGVGSKRWNFSKFFCVFLVFVCVVMVYLCVF